uniref:Uncharacterized protein n=1 Tax=Rhizophora mucronata TaxID=61149 RepID=A0A2P2NEW3_RHIMU
MIVIACGLSLVDWIFNCDFELSI